MPLSFEHPLQILVADDEVLARQRVAYLLDDLQKTHPTQILAEATNGLELLQLCQHHAADAIILDIDMPGLTGLEFSRQLALNFPLHRPALIFTTAHRDYACEAFEVDASDYLVKPIRLERLAHALEKVYLRKLSAPAASSTTMKSAIKFSIPGRQQTQWIEFENLLFLKAENKYTTVVNRLGEHLIETSLTDLEAKYPAHLIRIHRNCLAVRQHILELRHTSQGWYIRLNNWPHLLEVSRRQLSAIKELLMVK
ncbi:MAG: LytTR family DNA-binding domain-containing protein [Pseudomonadota bacterium]